MIRAGIVGGTGKLGKDILSLLWERGEVQIGAVVVRPGHPLIGSDACSLIDGRVTNAFVTDDLLQAAQHCDVLIDCANAEAFGGHYDAYFSANKPIVVATTGFSAEDMEKMKRLANFMPIVLCPNFSIGVYKFIKLVEYAARLLDSDMDVDIFDYHHKWKKDKPSGTAQKLAETIEAAFVGSAGREGDIPIHSVRAGSIVGEHRVLFVNEDNERIELSHQIFSRKSFAKGVVQTVKWIKNQEKGLFGIEDIFQTELNHD